MPDHMPIRAALWRLLAALVAVSLLTACPKDSARPAPKKPGASAQPTERPLDLESLRGKTVLLVTHASRGVVDDLVALRDARLLTAPDLTVVAIYHEKEWGRFKELRRSVRKRKLDWIRIHELSCALPRKAVFRDNDCTPELRRLVDVASAVLVPGGADLPPSLYGEETAAETRIATPNRSLLEATLLAHLVGSSRAPKLTPWLDARPTLPVLAICLGMQTLSVAAGGDLVQDLRSELYDVHTIEAAKKLPRPALHRNPAYELYPSPGITPYVLHPILPKGRPALWDRLVPDGEAVTVASNHHQAVDRLGKDLEVLATSEDGRIVEAIGHTRFPHVLGVQFHPESRELYQPDRRARLERGAKIRNHLATRVGRDARMLRLHQELWRMFGEWMAAERAARP